MNGSTVKERDFDVAAIREDFPILKREVNGYPLIYFDNAATSQKPQVVIDAISNYYSNFNSNIHRGLHTLADEATLQFENTRKSIQKLLNAEHREEIIFTRGTTESINLVASSFGKAFLNKGDEVIVSNLEHHSNIVPWQMACDASGATLKVIPINEAGELIQEEYENLLSPRTKMVSIVHVSNALGTINPIKEMIAKAHAVGAKVMIDGAQSIPHMQTDVQALDCDFYAFSGHKMMAPTGVGALYGKKELLEQMPPYQGGGEMISNVTFAKTTYNELPYKFEAGTPNIADVVALKSALDYLQTIGYDNISAHEHRLLDHATNAFAQIDGMRFIGTAKEKVSVVSFVVDDVHNFDIGQMLDARGIAVRTGNHCTQPIMEYFGLDGTVRASFAFYNTKEEIDVMAESLNRTVKRLRR